MVNLFSDKIVIIIIIIISITITIIILIIITIRITLVIIIIIIIQKVVSTQNYIQNRTHFPRQLKRSKQTKQAHFTCNI